MQISELREEKTVTRGLIRLAGPAALVLTLFAVHPAQAFDPEKVFEGNVSSKRVFQFYFDARKKGQEAEAVSVLKYAADQGNPGAQWKLGRMYQTGDGVERDPLQAFNIFKGIADRYDQVRPGSPDGQFAADAMVALGDYYRLGIPEGGLRPDRYQARIMYTTAAMVFRNPDAQFQLARMSLEPAGGMHDPRLAARMLRLASRKGHVGAIALLGHLMFEGEHISADPVGGLVMMSQARDRAEPVDQEWISLLHEGAFALASEEQRAAAAAQLSAN